MKPMKNCKVVERNNFFTIYKGGGSIDIGLLGENHHKINLIASECLLLNEGVAPLWYTSYTTLLNG